MNNKGKHIIHQVKFLGIGFYKRIRLEEHEIQINAQQNIIELPGLMVAANYFSFSSSKPNWETMAYQTIELTLLNLIINNSVELIIFTDTKHYLYGLFNAEYKNYRLVLKDKYLEQDILSQAIINAIKNAERDKGKKTDIKTVIQYLLDGYLDRDKTYKEPQKSFMAKLFRPYNYRHLWLTVEVPEGVTFQNQIKLYITQQKQAELWNSYQILSNISTLIKRESRVFRLYTNEFHKIIHSEFERRKPRDD